MYLYQVAWLTSLLCLVWEKNSLGNHVASEWMPRGPLKRSLKGQVWSINLKGKHVHHVGPHHAQWVVQEWPVLMHDRDRPHLSPPSDIPHWTPSKLG